MKIRLCLLSLLAIIFAMAPVVVMAEDNLDDDRLSLIRTNCVAAQSTIQRIGRNDTTSRINRGRDYDAVLKLFYAMNSRLASNNMTEPELTEITKNFEDELQNFRDRYNDYNGKYKSTIDINCESYPADFYNKLETTRSSRQAINDSIKKLDELITEYKATLKEVDL